MKVKYFIIAVLGVFSLGVHVRGEGQLPDSTPLPIPIEEQQLLSSRDKEIHEMIEMLREIHLFQELRLSEEKAAAVIQKMRLMRELKRNYLGKRYSLENDLGELLTYTVVDQDKISTILQTLESVKHDYYQQILETDRELQDLLTPEERAKYVLFHRNFNQKLKEIILSIRKENINPPQNQNQILRKQPTESVIRQAH
ncbi:hypothetical protein U27_01096 [Candidatus Vecturithrix granuli]|uniref:Periplasmic heavy metal sensor n=1 Tax=Vecturithrix granuli TaxID=1499967 RepID=A0A081C9E2_VECG1|nr:hypothetical protein U27_01096 [Candidatus Vecturithrix granuli]